jgi:ribose 1,5-bisphosphokinase
MGGFILVVGPSGAGKDTLLRLAQAKLASDRRFRFPKRIVTRASSPWEDHDTLDKAAFDAAEKEGRFALSWRAHGLCYAVPGTSIGGAGRGQVVVCNVSRQVVAAARRLLPEVSVVEVTAPPEILLARLAARGRSEDGDLKARLGRSAEIGDVAPDLIIENTRPPEAGAAELIRFLERRAALSSAAADA